MLLYISLLLILVSILMIIHNWRININTNFLAFFLFLFGVYGLAHYFIVYGKSVFWIALLFNNISPFMLLAGPFLYFYIRGTLKDSQGGLRRKDFFHFIPALIHFIGVIPYYLTPFSYKRSIGKLIINNVDAIKDIKLNIFFDSEFNFIFRLVLLFVYLTYSFILLWRFSKKKNKIKKIPNNQYKITMRWLVSLLCIVLFLLLSFSIVTFYFLSFTTNKAINSLIFVSAISGVAFCALSFVLFFFPEILYGMPKFNIVKHSQKKGISVKMDVSEIQTYNIDKSDEPFQELAEQIMCYLTTEKPFLSYDFSMSDISIALKVQESHVAYCFRVIMKIKFIKLKTQLRVAHAIDLIDSGLHEAVTFDAIAQNSGFKTRSNFYKVFKDEMGVSPSDYLLTKTIK